MSRSRLMCAFSFLVFLIQAMVVNTSVVANEAVLNRISEDIKYLASDELEGRGIGTKGLDKAADYIRGEFKKLGLKSATADGTYFQELKVPQSTLANPKETLFSLQQGESTTNFKLGEEFQPYTIGGSGEVQGELFFAGYGITAEDYKYDDFAGKNVEDKILVIFRYEPQQGDKESVFEGTETTEHSYIRTKMKLAEKHKAAAVLFVNPPYTTKEKEDNMSAVDRFGSSSFEIPFVQISQDVFTAILKQSPLKTNAGEPITSIEQLEESIDASLQSISQPFGGGTASLKVAFEKKYSAVVNVAAVLEGHGPQAEETIVIGAHYDHLGFGGKGSLAHGVTAIHNGADDNASGTAALLEIARSMAKRRSLSPRRIVFIAFTAEEQGLIGSDYYVENPLVPLDKTIAMFNYDMVGNMKENALTVYGTGTAKQFDKLVEQANEKTKLTLNKISGVMGASDHYSFFRKEIPCFHFFSGFTQEYHTPKDDFETLNVAGTEKIVEYTMQLIDSVVKLEEPLEFVKTENPTSHGRGGMAYLGVTPNYTAEVKGLLLNGVKAKSPAEKGGLKAGDIITQFGDVKVTDIQGLADALRKYKPKETVKIIVNRKDKTTQKEAPVELQITLGSSGSN